MEHEVTLSLQQLDTLQQWNEAKLQAQKWANEESALRDKLVRTIFDSNIDEGTQSARIGEWTLKATKKLNYTLNNDNGEVSSICATLPDTLSVQLIRWKPELSLSCYRKLDAQTQALFNGVLTIKPSKPQLELIPPKQQ